MTHMLALDAAYGAACACVVKRDGERFCATTQADQPHSLSILPMLHQLLDRAGMAWSDLEVLAMGIGPGSFTGIRITAASMAGINASLKLPVLGISSLAITAMQTDETTPLMVVEDARAGDAYVGVYQHGDAAEEDRCCPWEEIQAMHHHDYIAQSEPATPLANWRRIPLSISRENALATLAVRHVGHCSSFDALPRFITPIYLSPSQAERKADLHAD